MSMTLLKQVLSNIPYSTFHDNNPLETELCVLWRSCQTQWCSIPERYPRHTAHVRERKRRRAGLLPTAYRICRQFYQYQPSCHPVRCARLAHNQSSNDGLSFGMSDVYTVYRKQWNRPSEQTLYRLNGCDHSVQGNSETDLRNKLSTG